MSYGESRTLPEVTVAYLKEFLPAVLLLARQTPILVRGQEGDGYLLCSTSRLREDPLPIPGIQPAQRETVFKRIQPQDIAEKVAEVYGRDLSEILGTSRQQYILRPRQIAMFLAREDYQFSFATIGDYFGQHHSTVMNSVEVIRKLLQTDESFQLELRAIRKNLPRFS